MHEGIGSGLERSCTPADDRVISAPSRPGLERIEARFAGHAFEPHRHDTYGIGLTLDGVQCFDYRGVHCDSPAGHAIVLHPDEVHNGHAGTPAGFRYRMLYLEPRLVRDALGGAGPLPFVRPAVITDPRLLAALRPALADLDRVPEEAEADAAVVAIAMALAGLDPSARRRRRGPAAVRAVERARALLDDNVERTVTSAELEEVSGLDRFALTRHFRAVLGTSPYRYLTMRRLDRVRTLIRDGAPLADAAAAAGFADQSHMTRQFKRTFGVSPGRWRGLLRR